MTSDERTDALLRGALGRRARPSLPPGFAARVLQQVAERDRHERARRRRGARLVLGAYWLAALVACAWILRSQPLPDWLPAVLFGLAVAAVPLSFAALLWPRETRAWLATIGIQLVSLPSRG